MRPRMLSKSDAQVRVYKDQQELALKAARHFARLADQYVIGCGHFTVALAGGSTPRAMFGLLAEEPFLDTVPWSSIYFFWGDERCVAPDHAESNFRMAHETLLSKVPVPEENIFRIPAENPDHDRAAEEYSDTLSRFFLAGPGAPRAATAPLSNLPRLRPRVVRHGAGRAHGVAFPRHVCAQRERPDSGCELRRETGRPSNNAHGGYDQQRAERDFCGCRAKTRPTRSRRSSKGLTGPRLIRASSFARETGRCCGS